MIFADSLLVTKTLVSPTKKRTLFSRLPPKRADDYGVFSTKCNFKPKIICIVGQLVRRSAVILHLLRTVYTLQEVFMCSNRHDAVSLQPQSAQFVKHCDEFACCI
jgi:hypothetical protein